MQNFNMKKIIQFFPDNMTENIIIKNFKRSVKINQKGHKCLRLRSWIIYNQIEN